MSLSVDPSQSEPKSQILSRLVHLWAMFGGVALFFVVGVNFFSSLGAIFGHPIPGDLELTELGVAIAAFAFLPFCQLHGANVTADIFTAKASPRLIAALKAFASMVALVFSLILLWRMSFGLLDQYRYGYTTSILRLPHWLAFVPILVSLSLLVATSMLTLRHSLHEAKTGGAND